MSNANQDNSRRSFLKALGLAGTAAVTAPAALAESKVNAPQYLNLVKNHASTAANTTLRLGLIGTGGMGIGDAQTALQVGGVELVAACDLYDGRLRRAKELWGETILTTRDYRQLLERSDIDVVINATTDHWHEKISTDAMRKGKHVYCEKPMVQKVPDGHTLIKVAKETGKVFQVGSQFASSIIIAKAKELLKAGDIGELVFVEAIYDRHSAMGAWQYSIPPDASPQTVDWDAYLGGAPKRPWDPLRFFRWRNYMDYGTGIAGDLYVHLLTTLHTITGSKGPERVYSSGGLRYWKDGRDVPDVMTSIMDYPKTEQHDAFQMVLRVNFANAGKIQNVTRIIGNEGQIEFSEDNLILTKKKLPAAPGYGGYDSFFTFTEDVKQEFVKQYDARYPPESRTAEPVKEIRFNALKGDDAHGKHFADFFRNVRAGSQGTIEDPVFGFRAAAPVLACNTSYFENRPVYWDPVTMTEKQPAPAPKKAPQGGKAVAGSGGTSRKS